MLGLIIIYFIGKTFYNLAAKHGKHKLGFGILGVLSYYGSAMVGGFIAGLVLELMGTLETTDERIFNLIGIPFAIIGCVLFYQYLKRQCENQDRDWDVNILDGDFFKKD